MVQKKNRPSDDRNACHTGMESSILRSTLRDTAAAIPKYQSHGMVELCVFMGSLVSRASIDSSKVPFSKSSKRV